MEHCGVRYPMSFAADDDVKIAAAFCRSCNTANVSSVQPFLSVYNIVPKQQVIQSTPRPLPGMSLSKLQRGV